MDLGKQIVDKSLFDKDSRNAGKVDDILLEIPSRGEGETSELEPPVVKAIITGPLALANYWPYPLCHLATLLYRLMGIKHPQPVEISWDEIIFFDAVVHLGRGRDELGLDWLDKAVSRLFIERIPGA